MKKVIDDKINTFIALIGAVDRFKMATYIVGSSALIVYLLYTLQVERGDNEAKTAKILNDFNLSLTSANKIIGMDRIKCDSIEIKYILLLEKSKRK